MPMERRTLVLDAGEVALDQPMVENNTRLVWYFERRARLAIAQNASCAAS
jgi:hypothetical protein